MPALLGMSSGLSVDDPALDPPGVTPGRLPEVTPGGGGGGVEEEAVLSPHSRHQMICFLHQRAKFSLELFYLCPFWSPADISARQDMSRGLAYYSMRKQ